MATQKRRKIHDDGLFVEGQPDSPEGDLDDAQLPQLVQDFPHLNSMLQNVERLLTVKANFFFDCFCGTAGITVGVCLHNVPAVAKPFVSKFGEEYDLLAHEDVLVALLVFGIRIGFPVAGHPVPQHDVRQGATAQECR